ncbi:MAG TPA: GNAT family N-acetyltransferase [Alphaproteobacteria bacterium]|jgi:ribosomal-protein-alanine N-acetyltransferase|nr:GNAT family N-acetyltransferase [Alphaproteobacteria bacterium]
MPPVLETPRLRLRPYRDTDLDGLAELCADPEVMRHFPETLDRSAAAAFGERIKAHFDRHGFGPWSVEIKGKTDYVGFVGLMVPTFETHFTPCVEVGWRLARRHWQNGYATEGARAVLAYGFETRGCDEIVSMTVPANKRSRAVMDRLGMTRDPADDFDHPNLPEGHVLRRHVLYRLASPRFADGQTAKG